MRTVFAYYGVKLDGFQPAADVGATNPPTTDVSILASNNIMALQFDAFPTPGLKYHRPQ